MTLTMDRIQDKLLALSSILGGASDRIEILQSQIDVVSQEHIVRELGIIQEDIENVLNQFNNLRTIATPENWRFMAAVEGVELPEEGEK